MILNKVCLVLPSFPNPTKFELTHKQVLLIFSHSVLSYHQSRDFRMKTPQEHHSISPVIPNKPDCTNKKKKKISLENLKNM